MDSSMSLSRMNLFSLRGWTVIAEANCKESDEGRRGNKCGLWSSKTGSEACLCHRLIPDEVTSSLRVLTFGPHRALGE